MKYNRYLIIGVIILTLLLIFLFAGAISGPGSEYAGSISNNYLRLESLTVMIGLLVPLIMAGLYIYIR